MSTARPRTAEQPNPREVAVRVLLAGGGQSALDDALRSNDFTHRDRALLAQLVYGTLKRQRSLDWALSRIVKRSLAELVPALLWALRIGAYQLLYLEKIPAHSAVNESVRVARRLGHTGTAGLANAVLRKLALTPIRPPVPDADDRAVVFANYASLPDWLAQHFIDRFGFERALKVGEGVNRPPRRAARANVRIASVDETVAILERAGISVARSRYGISDCIVLAAIQASSAATLQRMIRSGRLTMQSEESQLAVSLLDPHPGEIVLDVCAGRGVKTGAIAARSPAKVYAIDDDANKLALLQHEMVRLGEEIVEVAPADATRQYDVGPSEGVDAVLVDAPCTGIGTIGRRADLRWAKQERDPGRLARVQSAILERAADHTRPGGRLLYVTCSTDAREDEDVVNEFLASHPQWRVGNLEKDGRLKSTATEAFIRIGEYALTIPGLDGADGFFYAMLHKQM